MLHAPHQTPLMRVTSAIVTCERCPRLRHYCQHVAREKRAAYRHETYWGRPVPGFGDPAARLLILGLAPAAHGANRTGRVFTGDGTGGSGDFLMAALHRAGFSNLPTSTRPDDGLQLTDAYIIATVRCAPPDNKPLPEEIAACATHLDAEVAALGRLQVVVALGKIAWDAWFQHLARRRIHVRPRPSFAHGAVFETGTLGALGPPPLATTSRASSGEVSPKPRAAAQADTLIGCYHPSRQNTNTGKVTAAMYDDVFNRAKAALR
jgi:uracil-DNA glycosylase